MDIFWEALKDALIDTLWVIPFLYLAYLLVGYFSHEGNGKYSKLLHHTKKVGPLVGAFLGCVPQCGFSSVMSKLYSNKVVTLGTLMAVFIATSDEAIPLMISKPEFVPKLLLLLAFKVAFAIVIGYAIDLMLGLFTIKKKKAAQVEVIKEGDHCEHAHDEKHEHDHCCAKNIFVDALKHTLIITAWVFVATLIINLVLGYAGLDALKGIFTDNIYLQIVIGCAIGLIPNCAGSVFLVELYMSGALGFAALVGGLCAGAGVGLIVLFTVNKKKIWQNLAIVVSLYAIAVGCGMIVSLFNIV